MKFDSTRHSRSLILVQAVVAVFFVFFIIFPLLCALFSVHISDFKALFTQDIWHIAMKNTLAECLASTTLSVLTGYIFAYAVVRGNLPFKRFFSILPVLHLITPPFVGGLAFILLFGRQGFITHRLLGLNVSLYGFWGLLIAQTLCFFPMAYLICLQTLKGINPNLERAARGMGAGNAKVFFTVTLPLSFPGIISSFLFIAVSVLSDFGNPLIVAGRYRVLAVEIYTQLTGWLNSGMSVVLGLVLVVPSVILFFLQNRLNSKLAGKTATVGGKSSFLGDFSSESESSFCNVCGGKMSLCTKILLFVFVLFISVLVLAQLLAIIAGSFQKLWGVKTDFTFEHIKSVFKYGIELRNSLTFAFISAVMGTAFACVCAFLVHRTNVRFKKTIEIFSQLPSAIPGTLLGLSISVAANMVNLHAAPFLIIVAMTVSFMPFAYKSVSNSLIQISRTLDDSALSLGANEIKVFTTVLLPLAGGGVFNGFVYDFIRGVGTLSAVIFLVSFSTPLASIKIINLAEQGDWGKAAAFALVLTVITFAVLALAFCFYRHKKSSR